MATKEQRTARRETRIQVIFRSNEANEVGSPNIRTLQPSGGLTEIIRESTYWDDLAKYLPKVGDRIEEFYQGKYRLSNWVIADVHVFSSETTQEKIVTCYCDYIPVEAEWQEVKRGKPVSEMLAAVEAK